MTIFLLILAILLVGGTALLASGRRVPGPTRRTSPSRSGVNDGDERREQPATRSSNPSRSAPESSARQGMVRPVASLPPVLLPDTPTSRDVDALRFGLGLRGYRMDQVDEVLDRLADALDDRDAVIRGLQQQLGQDSPAGTPTTPRP